jgi:septal ring factor EnvC (AmiA/AmiB activator)
MIRTLVLVASLLLSSIIPAAAGSNAGCVTTASGLDSLIRCLRSAFELSCDDDKNSAYDVASPVDGMLTLRFGEATQYGGQSHGVVYQGRNGLRVSAPLSGVVVFVGALRSYGDLLIIDDCRNVGLLAGDASFSPPLGSFLKVGAPVGLMHAAGASPPVLYFELRNKNGAIAPPNTSK